MRLGSFPVHPFKPSKRRITSKIGQTEEGEDEKEDEEEEEGGGGGCGGAEGERKMIMIKWRRLEKYWNVYESHKAKRRG